MVVSVVKVNSEGIHFNNGMKLTSEHEQDCCESHELTFTDSTLSDFKDLEFDLSNDDFFKKIPGYGIELVPVKGYSVKIPGHGYNNGYYGTNIDMIIYDVDGKVSKKYNVSECQVVEG